MDMIRRCIKVKSMPPPVQAEELSSHSEVDQAEEAARSDLELALASTAQLLKEVNALDSGALYYQSNQNVSPAEQVKDFVCEHLGLRTLLQLLKERDYDLVYSSLQVINGVRFYFT